jgi:hypothetical protein
LFSSLFAARSVGAALLTLCIAANAAAAEEELAADQPQGAASSAQSTQEAAAEMAKEPAVSAAPAVETFLDRLMRAESNGRDFAANPRSTALGAFQFIKSTFVEVARRHFADEVSALTDSQILALRTDRTFARKAAAAYTNTNAALLAEQGLDITHANLRLAYLLGPYGAIKVLQASRYAPVSSVLPAGVLRANPFMGRMRAAHLIAKAARDVGQEPESGSEVVPLEPHIRPVAARPSPRVSPRPAGPNSKTASKAACNGKLTSCRRFLALKQKAKSRVVQSRGSPKTTARKAYASSS